MIPVFLMNEAYYSARILCVGLDFRLIMVMMKLPPGFLDGHGTSGRIDEHSPLDNPVLCRSTDTLVYTVD